MLCHGPIFHRLIIKLLTAPLVELVALVVDLDGLSDVIIKV